MASKFTKFLSRTGVCLLAGMVICAAYLLLNGHLFASATPKQMILERQNARLIDKIEYISQKSQHQAMRLSELEMRDNRVYRPIFGMDEIPTAVRNAGFGAPERYAFLEQFANADFLYETLRKQEIIEKKAYIQSKSYDDVEKVATRVEDMARFIPTLMPVCPGPQINITSPFGYRLHPVFQSVIFHSGTDIAGPRGTPIYAAADGVVTDVRVNYAGYGNVIDIDHDFGYSTRYGHLESTNVVRGQVIHRGDQIATMGSSGRATGPHLHYEVLYHDNQVNPWNYFDKNIDPKTYMTLVTPASKIAR
ncbi:MAG: M23 family metallopeptidase [Bacteroidales bacterium]|nr:M23 family metallopeptidase [Bacteroidales bacterium]